ncbi:undecaprenyl-phosphate glucose phosphotransferase [Chitinophaga sp. 30R24]|uniref:undecaprenyl-phosphate glucose phosphotransferase n=1 Tax=Chitinophaga sp. 30R24 TaxID=3248838 RepID=UPI003B90D9DA
MRRVLRLLSWVNISLDILTMNMSLLLSYYVLLGNNPALFKQILPYLIIVNLWWLFAVSYFKIYDGYQHRNSIAIFGHTFKAFLVYTCCLGVVFMISLQNDYFSEIRVRLFYFYAIAALLFATALLVNRLALLSGRKIVRQRIGHNKRNIVIVIGKNPHSRALSRLLPANAAADYQITGVFHDYHSAALHREEDTLYKGLTSDCIPFIRSNRVDEIYCAMPGVSKENVTMLMHEADRNLIRVKIVPDYYEYFQGSMNVEMIDDIPVMTSRKEPLENMQNAAIKRLFDIIFSILVIVLVLSWLTPILALLIKLESKGPVFFKQLRSGRSNRPFYCLKFRSMTINELADVSQAVRGDARITRIGAFMRKNSMDEFPQFFNVLVGNMSVIGPRPHMLRHTEEYAALIEKFMVRHFLKPGITGWAQVNGLRGETRNTEDMKNRLEADVYYLEHWSLLFDLKIVFLTIWNIIRGDNKAF